ncbi:MAG: c-type cytochrome [Betaproteobacteria bacterium]|nr:c-type cytochrome [Betaproteobacteria bacterium]
MNSIVSSVARASALMSLLACAMASPVSAGVPGDAPAAILTPQAAAGRKLFFDPRLSNPPGVSCASCHNPQLGWAGNNGATTGVAAGSVPGARGTRNTPTVSYVGLVPAFQVKRTQGETLATGGLFWDGRANTLEEQARGPLFAKAEMNLADDAELAARVRAAPYAAELRAAFALPKTAGDAQWVQATLSALAAYQRSAEVAPFTSKYDAWLRGQATLSEAEARGLKLFANKDKGNCIACHAFNASSKNPADHLFTDFAYRSIGVPRNMAIAANRDAKAFDLGLCGPNRQRPKGVNRICGTFKVPTLRNVAKRPFLFHNGSFTRLDDAVRFYVQRDSHPEKWYPTNDKGKTQIYNDLPRRYIDNIRHGEAPYDTKRTQTPHLNEDEIADVVAFLKALDDGFVK